jgi:hypothetical protein
VTDGLAVLVQGVLPAIHTRLGHGGMVYRLGQLVAQGFGVLVHNVLGVLGRHCPRLPHLQHPRSALSLRSLLDRASPLLHERVQLVVLTPQHATARKDLITAPPEVTGGATLASLRRRNRAAAIPDEQSKLRLTEAGTHPELSQALTQGTTGRRDVLSVSVGHADLLLLSQRRRAHSVADHPVETDQQPKQMD